MMTSPERGATAINSQSHLGVVESKAFCGIGMGA